MALVPDPKPAPILNLESLLQSHSNTHSFPSQLSPFHSLFHSPIHPPLQESGSLGSAPSSDRETQNSSLHLPPPQGLGSPLYLWVQLRHPGPLVRPSQLPPFCPGPAGAESSFSVCHCSSAQPSPAQPNQRGGAGGEPAAGRAPRAGRGWGGAEGGREEGEGWRPGGRLERWGSGLLGLVFW